jgi:Domain of unknown function (DUF1707)
MTDRIRASDQDRESVVTVLRQAYSEGRLSLDEFDERISAAYAARTWGDLRALTADLPVQPVLDAGSLPVPSSPAAPVPSPDVAADPVPAPVRPPRPFGRLLPAVFIWTVLAAAAHASQVAVVLGVVFVCLLIGRLASNPRRLARSGGSKHAGWELSCNALS